MAVSDAEIRKATALYWNVAESAARLGSTTYELWLGLRSAAAEAGLEKVGVSIGAISRLRGQAGGIVRAAGEYEAASRDQAVTPAMVGLWPTARPIEVRNTSPETLVRGTRSYTEGGVTLTSRFTFKYGSLVGLSVGEVADLVERDALTLAEGHDQAAAGIGAFEIIAM